MKYTKTFSFGKVDGYQKNIKNCEVKIDMSLEIKDLKPRFSASAELWNSRGTDIIRGGQCLDSIYKEHHLEMTRQSASLYRHIMELWEKHHLNDMHPDCIHQRQLWKPEDVTIAKIKLDYDLLSEQNKIKDIVDINIKAGNPVTLQGEDLRLYNLPYSLSIPIEDLDKYPDYTIDSEEVKSTGWLRQEEHPRGYLSKPCPQCGYKYGSSWVYEPIPLIDLKAICNLLEIQPMDKITIYKMAK